MRPIKFRIWDRYAKEMANVKTLDFGPRGAECAVDYSDINGDIDGDWDLMEYTGIKDKNGIEIYEGDIIKSEGYLPVSGFNGNFAVSWDEENLIWIAGCFRLATFLPGVTVIGNVYENSELLEADNETN